MSLKDEKLLASREQSQLYGRELEKMSLQACPCNIKPRDLKLVFYLTNDQAFWKIKAANVKILSSEYSCLTEEVAWTTLHLLR